MRSKVRKLVRLPFFRNRSKLLAGLTVASICYLFIRLHSGEEPANIQLPATESPELLEFERRNEENGVPASSALFTLVDDFEDRRLYGVDYSHSHPFENTCRFPVLRPDEPNIESHVHHSRAIVCPAGNFHHKLVVQLRTGELIINQAVAATRNVTFNCYAIALNNTMRPLRRKLKMVGGWARLPFNRPFHLDRDQVYVKCVSIYSELLFLGAFTNIPTKTRLNPPRIDRSLNFSLSVLAIDSTSRNQFFRHMPDTLRFMRKHDFQILHGYNKAFLFIDCLSLPRLFEVGDNSAINMMPLFAGKVFDQKFHALDGLTRRTDMQLNDSDIFRDHWEHANFLTKQVKDRGGVTLWQDDIYHSGLGLLNYDKFMGFHRPPADYYYRPYFEFLFQKTEINSSCLYGESVVPRWLGLWEKFATKYKDHWNMAFNFFTTITHDTANPLELFDSPLEATLKRMEKAGVFENTVLVIMGDHGQRIQSIQSTFVGRIEERQPFMALYFPQKFRTAHPEWYATFKENKNRLVSNFDLHETFREILRIEDADRKPVGRSLFTRIPERRSCEDARIAEHHCLCMRKESVNLDEGVKANMTALIDGYAAAILGELECVREFELKPPPKFVGRTINAQARTGARFPSMWVDRLNEKPEVFQARWNEIFDVEFESRLDIRTASGALRRFQLRSRVFFQRKTGEIWRNAESFVYPADRSTSACKPLILENLCSCFL